MNQSTLHIDLEAFQGPFDLLLHLIKKMEVDINDIPMTEITQQYLMYVKEMQDLQLDIIGDYLVMAATLIEIKSRLLLPIEPTESYDEDFEYEDPRQALVQQLLLYQQFQAVADSLQLHESHRQQLFTRPVSDLSEFQEFVPLEEGDISTNDLAARLSEVLQREQDRLPIQRNIAHDSVTVDFMMERLIEEISNNNKGAISFGSFVRNQSKPVMITSFLAMLELVRKNAICFKQAQLFEPIYLQKKQETGEIIEFN